MNSDNFYFTLPKEMYVTPVGLLPCEPDKSIADNNVIKCVAQSAGEIVQVKFTEINQPLGKFYVIVGNIKNPPSLRKSRPLTNVILKTH